MGREAAEAAARAKKIAKNRELYKTHLAGLQSVGLILAINDLNKLTSWEFTGATALVGVSWTGSRISSVIIRDEDGNATTLARSEVPSPPNVSSRLGAEIPIYKLSAIDLEFRSQDADAKQEISLHFRLDANPNQYAEFKADSILPANETSATLLNFVPQMVTNELVWHLHENALYYSQAIWMEADSGTLAMQLSPYQYNGKRVIEYIDPTPLSTAGNFLVFRWKDEVDGEWKKWKEGNVDHSKVEVDLVALPTGGVFAEAVLGRFNSAEKLDITRFWNWQDSPIPFQAPEIAALQAGQHQISPAPQTGTLEAPIINIQTPQSLPDPTGMQSIVSALTTANMFRDMSGAAQTAALAQAALQSASQGATSAMSQAGANMATAGQFQLEMTKALLPLVGAALGIPVPPSTGTSNISNAGASINHGAKLDALNRGGAGSDGGGSGFNGGREVASGGNGNSGGVGPGSPAPLRDSVFADTAGGHQVDAFNRTINSGMDAATAANIITAANTQRGTGGASSVLLQTALEKGQGAALALADAVSKWRTNPDTNLSKAMKDALLKFAEDSAKKDAEKLLENIPLGKALKFAIELSLALADGVGIELRSTNARLNDEYNQAIQSINLGDDGLGEKEIERMRFLSSYQLIAVRKLQPIVETGLKRMVGQAASSVFAAAGKIFDDNLKQIAVSLANNDEFISLVGSLVEEKRGETPTRRRKVEEGIMAFVVRAFVRQLPKSEFQSALSNSIKDVKGDKPIVIELLAGTIKAILELESGSIRTQLGNAFPDVRRTILDTAKEFHLQFKSDGSLQLIPVDAATVEIDENKLTAPQSIIAELEAAAALGAPPSFEELSAVDAFFAVKQIQGDRLRVLAVQRMNRINHSADKQSARSRLDSDNRDSTLNAMRLVQTAWESLASVILGLRPELGANPGLIQNFIRDQFFLDNTLMFYNLDKMQIGSLDADYVSDLKRTDRFLNEAGIEL